MTTHKERQEGASHTLLTVGFYHINKIRPTYPTLVKPVTPIQQLTVFGISYHPSKFQLDASKHYKMNGRQTESLF